MAVSSCSKALQHARIPFQMHNSNQITINETCPNSMQESLSHKLQHASAPINCSVTDIRLLQICGHDPQILRRFSPTSQKPQQTQPRSKMLSPIRPCNVQEKARYLCLSLYRTVAEHGRSHIHIEGIGIDPLSGILVVALQPKCIASNHHRH